MKVSQPPSMIEHISTCWPMIRNPVQFVMRYAPAIRSYLGVLVRNPHEADDVAQDFLTRVVDKGFCPNEDLRGRFRDYLKAAIRYAAISHLRRKLPAQVSVHQLDTLIQPDSEGDCPWETDWRTCLLDRVWQALELHQQSTPGNLAYVVLRQYTQEPDIDSETHAARLSKELGRPIRADGFRQQLRRARMRFAQLVVEEVRQTLHNPTDEAIEQELIDLHLLAIIRKWLGAKSE